MSKIKDEPAFPVADGAAVYATGLTKREYFAGLAMQGYCANPEMRHTSIEAIGKYSVQQADALLSALNKDAEHE